MGFLVLQGLTAPEAQGLGFATLQSLMSQHDITTVEDLLPALPESLRSQYVLMFHSRGLQGASYARPRVLMFGDDATLVVTFNGDDAEPGYDAVETMEFDASSSNFLFREIRFNGSGSGPMISEINPSRCRACHGTPARPVWDTPPSWPGAYGERYQLGLSRDEAKGIREFLAIQPTHARYKSLLSPDRFAERDTYVTSATATYNGRSVEPPNARLSSLLTRLNTRVIMAGLVDRPAYASHRFVLLAAAEGDCGPLADFYPRALRVSFDVQLRDYRAAHARVDAQQDVAKSHRLSAAGTLQPRGVHSVDLAPLRFVVERGLGASTESWTLALEGNTFDLAAPPGTWTLREALFQEVAAADAKFASLRGYRTFVAGDAYCKRLAESSERELSAWYSSHPELPPPTNPVGFDVIPPVVNICASCHTGEVAPQIPFASPDELGPRLRAGNYPHGRLLDEVLYRLSDAAGNSRMPRGFLLPDEQNQALKSYFIRLANMPN